MTDTQFQNGTRIIVQRRPGAASAAVVIALAHGSRHPLPEHAGLPHLLEHLLFRSAAAGAEGGGPYHAFEAAGGECNASVGRELTLLEGLVPAGRAIGLLRAFIGGLQCLDGSTLAVQNECEAIARESDAGAPGSDTDMEQQALAGSLGNHGLARAPEGVAPPVVPAVSLQAYWRTLLQGSRLCIAVVGDVDEREVVRAVQPLAGLPAGAPIRAPAPAFRAGERRMVHGERCGRVLWLMPAPATGEPGFVASLAANHILGGGLTSRLYRALRTEAGWCYHVASRLEHYSDAGLWWVDARSAPEVLEVCAVRLANEVQRLAATGPQPAETALARDHLTSRLCLEEDHPASCARRLAREALYLGTPRPVAFYRDAIAALSAAEVQEIVRHGLEHRHEVLASPGTVYSSRSPDDSGNDVAIRNEYTVPSGEKGSVTNENHLSPTSLIPRFNYPLSSGQSVSCPRNRECLRHNINPASPSITKASGAGSGTGFGGVSDGSVTRPFSSDGS